MQATVPGRVQITVQTRWKDGERFTLTLDGPRSEWDVDDVLRIGRRAAEAAGIIAEPVTALEISMRWPYEVGAGVLLRTPAGS